MCVEMKNNGDSNDVDDDDNNNGKSSSSSNGQQQRRKWQRKNEKQKQNTQFNTKYVKKQQGHLQTYGGCICAPATNINIVYTSMLKQMFPSCSAISMMLD